MLTSIALALLLVFASTSCHLIALHGLSGPAATVPMRPMPRVLVIVLAIFGVHMVEISLYALAYWTGGAVFGIGGLNGFPTEDALDYLYFSAVTFTSLGIGDVFPYGHLRFLTGIEALNGLLLIAWSGSFIFVAMSRLWNWRPCVEPRPKGTTR